MDEDMTVWTGQVDVSFPFNDEHRIKCNRGHSSIAQSSKEKHKSAIRNNACMNQDQAQFLRTSWVLKNNNQGIYGYALEQETQHYDLAVQNA